MKKNLIFYIIIIILVILFCLIIFLMTSKNTSLIRQPAVTGIFYPKDKEKLSRMIDSFLAKADTISLEGKPQIIIVPHAGYEFSGSVAAYGFKTLENKNYKRAIIIGPSHQSYFSGFAISQADFWQTPLGKIKIDKNLREKISKNNNLIFISDNAHLNEHCLEVEVPFLQKINPQIKILPIIIGPYNPQPEVLASVLEEYLDSSTILIISSDLSHYPPYEIAKERDGEVIKAILELDKEKFSTIVKDLDEANNLVTRACGEEAIKIGFILAEKLKLKPYLLKYANSGDTNGDINQVVGYASIAFLTENKNDISALSQKDKQELLSIARDSIDYYLKTGKILEVQTKNPSLLKPQGAFVTLKENGELRGCIGNLTANKPLAETVAYMAVEAAFGDPRFLSLEKEELSKIKIEISVLSPLKKINDPFTEIEIGKHGVLIEQGNRSGVFLPQVATENNWSLETFMDELCLYKAGISPDAWKTGQADIYVFTAEVFSEKE